VYAEVTQQKTNQMARKSKKSGEVGRQSNKTTACPNSAGLLSLCNSSPRVFLLTDSELQRHLAHGKLSPGAEVEASLAASHRGDSALNWEDFAVYWIFVARFW